MNNQKVFFQNIERLRGFACLLVFLQHIIWICPFKFISNNLPNFFLVGKQGANVFFIISGFVITLSLNRIFFNIKSVTFVERFNEVKIQLFYFLKKRIFRIFPVVLCLLLILSAFLYISESDTTWITSIWRAPFEILFGIFNTSEEYFLRSNCIYMKGAGPLWTLAVEIPFYIWWPVTFLVFKTQNSRLMFSLFLAAVFTFIVQPISFSYFGYQYYSTHQNLSDLFFGTLIAFIYLTFDQTFFENLKISNYLKYIISFILVLSFWMFPSGVNGELCSVKIGITCFCVVLLILAILNAFSIPGLNNIFDFFGKRSYSFYVVHLTLANIVAYYTESRYFPKNLFSTDEFLLYQFLMYFVILLIVTELMYKLIEIPSQNFGNK